MKIGTKSVLFGAHCFFIHPWFVALAWLKLNGFPWDPRLWVAFFVHDIGYIGKPNMDGPEGELHPALGARIMRRLFDDDRFKRNYLAEFLDRVFGYCEKYDKNHPWWYDFVYYHSRYLAKKDGVPFSKFCIADKLAITFEPYWLYIIRVRASGELAEYLGQTEQHHPDMGLKNDMSARVWHSNVRDYCRRWVAEHRDGKQDTWTRARV